MIPVSVKWIAEQLQCDWLGEDKQIKGVSTDTRSIKQGDLFIALIGPNFDGHSFVDDALSKGAVAVLVDHPVSESATQLIVKDTRIALGQLASAIKQKVAPKTVAITGSNGKTTVKEMTAAILGQKGKVLATEGNFNNDIGCPLTLLRLEADHEYAVIELGANHLGEIDYTSKITQPDVALINNVAPAHLEGFGDLFGVARAKGEIYNGLSDGGIAIFNADSEFSLFWQRRLYKHTMVTFGLECESDIKAENIQFDELGCASFTLIAGEDSAAVKLPVAGFHNVANALAAAAIAINLGFSANEVATGLLAMQIAKGRLNFQQLDEGLTIIDDTYNANATSAKAGIDTISQMPGAGFMVLGDMGELGSEARRYHQEVGEYAKEKGIAKLFSLGVLSQSASDAMKNNGQHFSDIDALVSALLESALSYQKVNILVKGSRSAHMENVVEAIANQRQFEQEERNAC
jgi:UDP-N-acetylmuramoyl-tripeptide--D-alanyl-D-alanine ligase